MPTPLLASTPRHRLAAALRLAIVPLVIVALHTVTRFSPWLLLIVGFVAVVLLVTEERSVPGLDFMTRFDRADRLALWIVLVCLTVIGYLHNVNSWRPDGAGYVRPDDVAMWKTELILGVALAVPLLHTLFRLARSHGESASGQQFAREFALYINFSGIALVLWSGEALLSRTMVVTVVAWVALAELTLYASD